MQKLVWINSKGTEINLTSGDYGITEWEGFSACDLEVQTQNVPFQDGSVFLDALLNNRELSVTLAINDGGDLEKRYQLRRELISALNPKLGEGYLIYTNDFISKRIKCLAQMPVFPTHNSDKAGTPKASLSWTACDPYWEDVEETSITFKFGELPIVNNNGDLPVPIDVAFGINYAKNATIKNLMQEKLIKYNGDLTNDIFISTQTGNKKVFSYQLEEKLRNIGVDYVRAIYQNGEVITICGNGIIQTTKDGISWNIKQTSFNNLRDIVYSNFLSKYVIIGDNGLIITSSNLETWEQQNSTVSVNLLSITYSEEKHLFVAVGMTGTILVSEDGITWEDKSYNTNKTLFNVSYIKEKSLFIITASSGYIITSQDGIIWSGKYIPTNSDLNYTLYVFNKIFICGTGGTIISTSDMITWNEHRVGSSSFIKMIYSEKLQMMFLLSSDATLSYTSSDGMSWDRENVPYLIATDIIYSEDLNWFIILGWNGQRRISVDLENWITDTNNIDSTTPISDIIYIKDLNIYVLSSRNIYTSKDKKYWYSRYSETGHYSGKLAYSDYHKYIVATISNHTVISIDGINWTYGGVIGSIQVNKLIFVSKLKLFICLGVSGKIATSNDGKSWELRNSGTNKTLKSICYSEDLNLLIAVGNGIILTSANGITWETLYETSYNYADIIYIKILGLFVIVGDGLIAISKDGSNFQTKIISDNLSTVKYSAKYKQIIAYGNKLYQSSNGFIWHIQEGISNLWVTNSCVNKDNVATFVGYNGIIFDIFFNEINQIQNIDKDSSMDLGLKIGENQLQLLLNDGDFYATVSYRQKYIGV